MRKRLILLILIMAFSTVQSSQCLAKNIDSSQDPILLVKATYLIKLVDFLKRPKESEDTPAICLFSNDKIYHSLMHIYSSNPAFSKRVRINAFNSLIDSSKIKTCRIFYFSDNPQWNMEPIAAALTEYSVVSISDAYNHIMSGGMIGFVQKSGNIRIELNMSRMQRLGISVNPKLIEISLKVI